jgi:hypothetical protein
MHARHVCVSLSILKPVGRRPHHANFNTSRLRLDQYLSAVRNAALVYNALLQVCTLRQLLLSLSTACKYAVDHKELDALMKPGVPLTDH